MTSMCDNGRKTDSVDLPFTITGFKTINILIISNVTFDDREKYFCRIENTLTHAKVEVRNEKSNINQQLSRSLINKSTSYDFNTFEDEFKLIHSLPEQIRSNEDDKLILFCQTNREVKHVQWFKNELNISLELSEINRFLKIYSFDSISVLILNHINENDSGLYTCYLGDHCQTRRTLHDLTSTTYNTIQFLQHLKLLPTQPAVGDSCLKKCNDWYLGCAKDKGEEGHVFRCRKCSSTKSIRNGSFFSKSKLKLRQIFELMYYWARQNDSLENLAHELELCSHHTIIDWKNFCRNICAIYYVNNPQKNGGPGHIVEIDENAFDKRKYNRGRLVKTQRVFDGIDIQTKKCFLVEVDQRDAATLLPIIEEYILPGTTIHSDEWRAYQALQNNPDYHHLTVNHSLNFVDPNTGVHTQNIENTWMKVKRKQKNKMDLAEHY